LSELGGGEAKRKVVHIGVGAFALLLRFLSWPQAALMALAALLFNWRVLPAIGGRALWRGGERAKGYPLGILLYPLSVLGLVLVFRHALWIVAALWGVLAVGDGTASLVGQTMGGPGLPWNARKRWTGLCAFVVFGTCAAVFLAAWTEKRTVAEGLSLLPLLLVVTLFCALVETLPTTLDDNLTVPLAGAVLLPLLLPARVSSLAERGDLLSSLLWGLGVNGLVALLAYGAGSIDMGGALSAVVIGTVIVLGLGLSGLSLMVAFFVLGSLATRLGYRVKAARGIAQERGGARGWRNAWANGGVPAFLAFLAAVWPDAARHPLVLAYAAAVATAAADTCSSEVGKAFGRRTFLITNLKPVPPGTEGAVSLEGTLAGLLGAGIVSGLGWVAHLYGGGEALLVALSGLLGSLAESVLGTVAEKRGWLDNDLLNALNTAIGAAIVVGLARLT
jgi:uncharacterized protein (TIGR00297 family)